MILRLYVWWYGKVVISSHGAFVSAVLWWCCGVPYMTTMVVNHRIRCYFAWNDEWNTIDRDCDDCRRYGMCGDIWLCVIQWSHIEKIRISAIIHIIKIPQDMHVKTCTVCIVMYFDGANDVMMCADGWGCAVIDQHRASMRSFGMQLLWSMVSIAMMSLLPIMIQMKTTIIRTCYWS